MSYIQEYKMGIIDEDEYRFYANRENREERDYERQMDSVADSGLKDLIDELREYGNARKGELAGMVLEAANRLEELAEEQEPKTGRWIMSDDGLYRPICNNCGAHPWKGYIPTVEEATEVFKYCPKCGAKMESEEENGMVK